MAENFEKNPFHISQNNADIIHLREEERIERAKARDISSKLKIWDKGKRMGQTASQNNRASYIKQFLDESENDANENGNKNRDPKQDQALQDMLEACAPYRIEEKEDISEFIAKKREMFLLQMQLDTKLEEIRKIEERARLKEEALKRSEEMLEEDGMRFDAFLKDNDKRAQDAIRKADQESKKKNDKIQEIKKTNHQIQAVQAEISKHTEALDDCLTYKSFLDNITPPEWFEEQRQIKKRRQEQRRRDRIERRRVKWKKDEEEKKVAAEAEAGSNKAGSQNKTRKSGKLHNRKELRPEELPPPEPDFEDEPLTSSDEDIPMYFERPQQLLDIFSGLEEENLFMIQNKQESEQALEQVKQKVQATQDEADTKNTSLEANIEELKSSIEREERITQKLSTSMSASHGNQQPHEENMFTMVGNKVKEVYQRCGFDDSGTTPTTLFMLSELEARMEEILVQIGELPEKYTRTAEKEKEKIRREIKRVKKLEAQQKAQDERNRKALERSMQPPKKRTTKQVMFRSYLVRHKKQEEKKEITQEELDEIRHLTA